MCTCMNVCVLYICVYVWLCIWVHLSVYMSIYVYMYVCVCLCLYTNVHVFYKFVLPFRFTNSAPMFYKAQIHLPQPPFPLYYWNQWHFFVLFLKDDNLVLLQGLHSLPKFICSLVTSCSPLHLSYSLITKDYPGFLSSMSCFVLTIVPKDFTSLNQPNKSSCLEIIGCSYLLFQSIFSYFKNFEACMLPVSSYFPPPFLQCKHCIFIYGM